MNALAGVDAADPSGPAAEGKIPADYTTFLDAAALKGKRIGVVKQGMQVHPDLDALRDKAVAALRAQGADVVDVRMATYNDWNDAELDVMLYEFKDGLNSYLKSSGSPHGSLEALIAWNKANADKVMPFFAQELFEQAQAKGPLTDPAYRKARDTARRLAEKDGLLAVLTRDKLDALVAVSTSPAWPTDHVLGDHFTGAGYGVAAVAGTPSLTVPIGETHGLPIGLTFMTRAYEEPKLLAFGYALEQSLKARKAPEYRATLDGPSVIAATGRR